MISNVTHSTLQVPKKVTMFDKTNGRDICSGDLARCPPGLVEVVRQVYVPGECFRLAWNGRQAILPPRIISAPSSQHGLRYDLPSDVSGFPPISKYS